MKKAASLLLADGTRFDGEGIGLDALVLGEAVFYTGMTGYEEALTDPSYAGQLLTFTYPMIGNYGISGTAAQHARACVAGAVIKRMAEHPSHHAMVVDLGSWLAEQHVPTLVGIDTRALTTVLREHGTIRAALAVGDTSVEKMEAALGTYARSETANGLVAEVADRGVQQVSPNASGPHVVLIDCGVKRAIVRDLVALGVRLTVLPYDATTEEVLARRPDAVVISPGPGDPADLGDTIETLRGLLGQLPMFGVCLGHQLLAIACGAKTYKLLYGHRGGNQPVKDLLHDSVLVTAHNHGYAVDGATLPGELEATMINLNDGTNEGFRHRTLPISAVQFHPEASPGPFDARFLFAEWVASLPA
ncbi:MAG: glutamine-hydrolyzing carbamoyl-phosphate synthase small subunit [Candidatus Eremiobacteraeota bacterium]|nr:glutamine-hydrolyzing carbamoyl-phosphate synthase small subunit [Candidatus Eremiobacteraeota bacterium]